MRLSTLLQAFKRRIATQRQFIDILRSNGASIGEGCVIDKSAEFGTEPYLISIGDKVRITRGVNLITHDGSMWVLRNAGLAPENGDILGKITIGSNSNIGWNATILPNVNIGNNCIVACGAIVTRDVPDNSVVAGVPARVIENIYEYADKSQKKVMLTKGMSNIEKRHFLEKNL